MKIVVKIGTKALCDKNTGLNTKAIFNFANQIAALHAKGNQIIIVSSGAVAAGRQFLKLNKSEKNIPARQMLAAIGQGILMEEWRKAFVRNDIIVAQALLCKNDFTNRKSYLNTRLTLSSLIKHKVIPIINENDVIATEELEFGDNDSLAVQVAKTIGADLLIILTDVFGLYTGNPQNSKSKLIHEVREITKDIENYAKSTKEMSFGGMATKIEAAKLANAAGIDVVIAKAEIENIISKMINGEKIGTRFYAKAKK